MNDAMSLISVIGRTGAGKGTQVNLLQERTDFSVIRTGDLLRERAQQNDIVGKTLQRVLEQGLLVPTPIVFSLWMPILEKIYNHGGTKGIIFDGNPRKLYEAQMLDEVFEMFGWSERFTACYIHISEIEAKNRLLERSRFDDTEQDIQERLRWFNAEVQPVLDYYKQKGKLIEVNGEQSIEEVHNELIGKLKEILL